MHPACLLSVLLFVKLCLKTILIVCSVLYCNFLHNIPINSLIYCVGVAFSITNNFLYNITNGLTHFFDSDTTAFYLVEGIVIIFNNIDIKKDFCLDFSRLAI